jgi:hypothetical protein
VRVFVVIGFEAAKETARWGTYGKGGVEHCGGTCPKHPLVWKRLVDCDTDHLQTILQYQLADDNYRELIRSILADRGIAGGTP